MTNVTCLILSFQRFLNILKAASSTPFSTIQKYTSDSVEKFIEYIVCFNDWCTSWNTIQLIRCKISQLPEMNIASHNVTSKNQNRFLKWEYMLKWTQVQDTKLKFCTGHYHHIVLEQYVPRNIYGGMICH